MNRGCLFLALLLAGPALAQPVPELPTPKSRDECNAFYAQYLRILPSDVSKMTREQQDFHANVMEARGRCWKVADGGKPGANPAVAETPAAQPAQSGPPVISSFQELESR